MRPSLLATISLVVALGRGQLASQEQPLFKSATRTVPVFATVLDSAGHLVTNLDETAFVILDNGKPVDIAVFSRKPQPFTSVVMLDTSASTRPNLQTLYRATEQFLRRLQADDRAQVGAFNDRVQLSGTFTNDQNTLVAALAKLPLGFQTRLHDAIGASLDAVRGVNGRRVVLVFTDGDDTASRAHFKTVLNRAQNEEVMVYAIGLESEYFNGVENVRTQPTKNLKVIAEQTGGGYFQLDKTDDLDATFSRVAEELRSQYLLGFVPATDGRQHKIDVRVTKPEMTVRARRTYVAIHERDN
jgi:Ca-activated chloride channel homolog